MRKLLFSTLILVLTAVYGQMYSQLTGGTSKGLETPTKASPEESLNGLSDGNVDLFSGTYQHSINLGTIATSTGTSFTLTMNYSSSGVTSKVQNSDNTIPYGEGWSLNLPYLKFINDTPFKKYSLAALQSMNNQHNYLISINDFITPTTGFEYCEEDLKKEYTCRIKKIHLNLPGVYSGVMTFKFVNGNGEAVFVPKNFDKYFELTFHAGGNPTIGIKLTPIATVKLSDGTEYEFRGLDWHFVNPTNQLMNGPKMGGTAGYSMTPIVVYDGIRISTISNPHLSQTERIDFKWSTKGKINHYAEFMQMLSTQKDYSSLSETILDEIVATDGFNSPITIQKLDLIYKLNPTYNGMLDRTKCHFLDDMYVSKTIFSSGDIVRPLAQGITSTSWMNWNIYKHAAIAPGNTTLVWNNFQTNWGRSNPYVFGINGATSYQDISTGNPDANKLKHSYIEKTNIPQSLFKPGYLYEIRTRLKDHSPNCKKALIDIDLTYSNASSEHNKIISNQSPYTPNYFGAKRGTIFTTFTRPNKWYDDKYIYAHMMEYTSNFFLMPDLKDIDPNSTPDLILKIGPANSDQLMNVPPCSSTGFIPNGHGNGATSLYYKRLYHSSGYDYGDASFRLKCSTHCEPCMYNFVPSSFGLGSPWSMALGHYQMNVPGMYTGECENWDLWYNFTHWNDKTLGCPSGSTTNPTTIYKNNVPTSVENVTVEMVEISQIEKMPLMLSEVKLYDYRSSSRIYHDVNYIIEYGLDDNFINEDSNLVSYKKFDYAYQTLSNATNMSQYNNGGGYGVAKYLLTQLHSQSVNSNDQMTEIFEYDLKVSHSYISSALCTYTNNFNTRMYILQSIKNNLGLKKTIAYLPSTVDKHIRNDVVQFNYIVDSITTEPIVSVSNAEKKSTKYVFSGYNKIAVCYDKYKEGFANVSVYHPFQQSNGKRKRTDYTFYSCMGCVMGHPCHASTIANGLTFGKLKLVAEYNEDNQLLKSVETKYGQKLAYMNGIRRQPFEIKLCKYSDGAGENYSQDVPKPSFGFNDYFALNLRPIQIDFEDADHSYFVAKNKTITTEYIKNKAGFTLPAETIEEYEYYDADYTGTYTSEGQKIISINTASTGQYTIDPNWNLYRTTTYSPQNPKFKTTKEIFYLYQFLNDENSCNNEGLEFQGSEYEVPTSIILKRIFFKYHLKDMITEIRTSTMTDIGGVVDTVRKAKYFKYTLAPKASDGLERTNSSQVEIQDSTLFMNNPCKTYPKKRDSISPQDSLKLKLTEQGCTFAFTPKFYKKNYYAEPTGPNGEKLADWDEMKVYYEMINNACYIRRYNAILNMWTICPCSLQDKINNWSVWNGVVHKKVNFIGLSDLIDIKRLSGFASPSGGVDPISTVGTVGVLSGNYVVDNAGGVERPLARNPAENRPIISTNRIGELEDLNTGKLRYSPNAFDASYIQSVLSSNPNGEVAFLEIPRLNKLLTINAHLVQNYDSIKQMGRPYQFSTANHSDMVEGMNILISKYNPNDIIPFKDYVEEANPRELYDLLKSDSDPEDPDIMYVAEDWYKILFKSEHEKIDDIVINKTTGIPDIDNRFQIARPMTTGAIDFYLPFHTIKNKEILTRNEFLQTDVEIDAKDLKTKYYYGSYVIQPICNSRKCPNQQGQVVPVGTCYQGLTYNGLFLPSRITSGYERSDSVGIDLYYNKNATLSHTISDQGARIDYLYDGYNRLIQTMKDGQVLNTYRYNIWDWTTPSSIDLITNQNFIETKTLVKKGATEGTISRAFIDPFGRKKGTILTPTTNIYSTATTYPTAIMSGEQVIDWEDKVIKQYKPFSVSGGLVVHRNSTTTGAPLEFQTMSYDYRSQPSRSFDYTIPTTSSRYSETKTTLESGSFMQSELNLNFLERYMLYWDANDYYLRTEGRDPDGKTQISYSYILGKKLADMTPMGTGLSNPPLVTLYAYDNKWDLKKVINPDKLETDYKTNLQGLVFEKTTPDQGLTNYFYDEVGNLVAMQDRKLWTENAMKIRLFTYDHFGRMLLQLKGELDMNLLCPNCNFGPVGGGGGSTSGYRPPHPLAYLYNLKGRSYDISYPPSSNPVISNTFGRSYYWLPNQNVLTEDIEGSHTIFDSLRNTSVEKLWVYNDHDLDYITTTTRKPNQNKLYTTKLTEILSKLPLSVKDSVNKRTQTSLGKLSTAASYDQNGAINEITTTIYNADELPEEEYHYAKFLAYSPKHFLIQYRDYNLAGAVGETELFKLNPSSGLRTSIYGQKMTYSTLGHLTHLEYKLATGGYVSAANYLYHLPSGKLTQTNTNAPSFTFSTYYTYDLRERLTQMSNSFFKENLYYDQFFPPGYTGTTAQNHNGNINATQTQFFNLCASSYFGTPLTSIYEYDPANRLKSAAIDAYQVSSSGVTSPSFGSQSYTYSAGGNLKQYTTTELTSPTAAATKDHFYHYEGGTNKLLAITNSGNPAVSAPYASNNRAFQYDPNGNVRFDLYRVTSMLYDRANLPYQQNKNNAQTYYYGYNTQDARIYKGNMDQAYYYLGGLGVYDINADNWEHYPSGLLRLKNGNVSALIKDHLSNTRAVVELDKNCGTSVVSAYDYYPYGKVLRKFELSPSRYLSTDHEKDAESGYDDRNARWYDDEALNFLQTDPHSASYPSWSPFHYVGRNPISISDPSGMDWYSANDQKEWKWFEGSGEQDGYVREGYGNIRLTSYDGNGNVQVHELLANGSVLNEAYPDCITGVTFKTIGGVKISPVGSKGELSESCHEFLSSVGYADPTPLSDGVDGLLHLAEGEKRSAGISFGAAFVPYLGDATKLGKAALKEATKGGFDATSFADEIVAINRTTEGGGNLLSTTPMSAINSAMYYETAAEQGSSIFRSIISNHMFYDGNKRTAVATFLSFARQHGLRTVSEQQIMNVANKIATGQISDVSEISKLLIK